MHHAPSRLSELVRRPSVARWWLTLCLAGLVLWPGRAAPARFADIGVSNDFSAVIQTSDGVVWSSGRYALTSYLRGRWRNYARPEVPFPTAFNFLLQSSDGALWTGASDTKVLRVDYQTSRGLNLPHLNFQWEAVLGTPQGDVGVGGSHHQSGQPWSAYTSERGRSFFSLPVGPHRLEVRARNHGFNVNPSPAVLDFVVVPPVWRQEWFVLLIVLSVGLIITQSVRVFLERGRLRRANRELATEIEERERAQKALRTINSELEQRVATRTSQLEIANQELEAFSYSVSHDLRAPLRSIDGFSRALLEDHFAQLDDEGKDHLERVCAAAQRMEKLIDDLLSLARVTRDDMHLGRVDLSQLAHEIADRLSHGEPQRDVVFTIVPGAVVTGDGRFLRIALENLLGNAWKFTAQRLPAKIEFGRTEQDGRCVYFVRDNGAGFDMAYAGRLFEAFRRFHDDSDYPGSGIGLSIVQRIIRRHGGRVWADAQVDRGATIYLEIPESQTPRSDEDTASQKLDTLTLGGVT